MPRMQELQQAFAIATRCSEDPSIPLRERNYFRAIAGLIYQAFGEPASKGVQ